MTFLAGWALTGLVLLGPLVILHLRQRAERTREVASLLLWHEFALESASATRRSRIPPLPLLLLLQAVALALLILALADPVLSGAVTAPETVVVLDDSFWMSSPGALAEARGEVARMLASAPVRSRVAIVLADADPSVLYRGSLSGATAALARVHTSSAAPDLRAGLTVAAGLLTSPRDRMVVIHAPQDSVPTLQASPHELRTQVAGQSGADQGIFDPSARCGIGTSGICEVLATVTNTGATPVQDHVIATVLGHPGLALTSHVAAHSSTQITLIAKPGDQVHLTLPGPDVLSLDNQAWVTVPGDDNVPRPSVVTVVGTRADALSLAQAFATVPGVRLRVDTPAQYRLSFARTSDLLVLDGWLPRGGVPATPAVMLVDPPRLPWGQVGSSQADTTLSGTDMTSPLLNAVDLSSLTVTGGAARLLTLPRWLAPVLWSPSGPLLAAGDNGHTRIIVTAFGVGGSNLAQLAAFPVLATNIVSWGLGWAPGSAVAGAPIGADALLGARIATLKHNGNTVDRVALTGSTAPVEAASPGVYTLRETGPGVDHQATVDVNLGDPASAAGSAVDIRTAQLHGGRAPARPLMPWLLAAALLVLVFEWAYWSAHPARALA